MEWLNNFVLIVTGENESAVPRELLNRRSEKELYIGSGIVCFINDDDFMFRLACKRDGRCEVLCVVPNSVEKTSFIRSINDIKICPLILYIVLLLL